MKFSKKLLTALLPIAATGAIVPAITSCNNGDGYVINFGDEVDCLNEKSTGYHSLDRVKAVVKTKAPIEQSKRVDSEDFPVWRHDADKQKMYYDLIASLSILANTKFHLIWTFAEEKYNISIELSGEEAKVGNLLKYDLNSDNTIDIYLMQDNETQYHTKSYCFQNSIGY